LDPDKAIQGLGVFLGVKGTLLPQVEALQKDGRFEFLLPEKLRKTMKKLPLVFFVPPSHFL